MRMRTVTIILGLFALSGFIGWQMAGDASLDSQSRSDDWDSLVQQATSHPNYRVISDQIKASGLLPPDKDKEGQTYASNGQFQLGSSKRVPKFPPILATAIVDGVPQVTLSMEDESISTRRRGDVLESGWEIMEVDLTLVVASFDDESHEFPVLSYDRLSGKDDQLIENGN